MTPNLEARIGNRTRRLLELTMAAALLGLGVQLTNTPGEVFKTGGALQPLMFLPPIVWTQLFTVLGSVRLVVVTINGVWPLSPTVRLVLSIFTLLIWACIAWGYWRMLPATQGFPALVLAPVVFIVEANCLFALSALRTGRRRGP
jgi:hypothetical protein